MLPSRLAAPSPPSSVTPDAAVRSTDSDALLSRVSCHSLGYFNDPDGLLFLSPAQRRSSERRPPLINIGTHARCWAVDQLVQQHVGAQNSSTQPVQVLSLGAGTDSRFWRLRRQAEQQGWEWKCRRWVEVDFAEATGAKARTVSGKAELKSRLGGDVKVELGGQGLTSPLYALLPGDLRSLPSLSQLLSPPPSSPSSSEPILDPTLPTLLLLECVSVYLDPSVTDALLGWFASTFGASGSAVVGYDPYALDDAFGQVMKRNLAMRNLSLPGAASTPSLASLTDRLRRNGLKGTCGALSVREIRERCVPVEENERVAKLEPLDEVEELNLVLEHYAVSWGNVCSDDAVEEGDGGIGLRERETGE
ncbi:hypothetical protein JCM10207_004817 [Rhodosporidiobolus poonsookiae]